MSEPGSVSKAEEISRDIRGLDGATLRLPSGLSSAINLNHPKKAALYFQGELRHV